MAKTLFYQLIYALIAGFSEFFPVSASAHQLLFSIISGTQKPDAVLLAAIHVGSLGAVLLCSKNRLARFGREKRLAKRTRRSQRSRPVNTAVLMDSRIFGTAMLPIVLFVILYLWSGQWISHVALLALLLLLNGVLLFLPRLLRQGNKDGRSLSRLDAILMGLGGTLGVFPGFSRIGGVLSAGTARGAERCYALDMALLLSIPALIGLIVLDVFTAVMGGVAISGIALLISLLCALISFGSGIVSIILIRYIFLKSDGTAFAYYSWGLALFSFILYLMIQ